MSEAAEPAQSRCARCGAGFHCGANDAPPCACTRLTLSPALLSTLRAQFDNCLCVTCLEQLQALEAASPRSAA